MKKLELYQFGYKYLVENCKIETERLDYYLNFWKYRQPATIEELCKNMIDHAKNRRDMSNSIGELQHLSEVLFNFNPQRILARYSNWEVLFDEINLKVKTPGRMEKNNPHNYWVIYCKSILSIAVFLTRFKSVENFRKYSNQFLTGDLDLRLALPLIIKEEIFGYQFALACDFIKENVSPEFIKPDTHIRYIFTETGICKKGDSDFDIFRHGIKYCQEIEIMPYNVDRLFWLIGSGDLFKTPKFSRKRFKTDKKKFVEKFKEIYE